MVRRQKRVDLLAIRSEREGVGPLFRCHTCELLHRFGVEYVDGAWVADGNIEAFVHPIEEHDIGRTTQEVLTEDFSVRIERDQLPRVAGAEQTMGVEIEIEPMRAGRRDSESARDAIGLPCVDHDNLRRVSNVHIEYLRL